MKRLRLKVLEFLWHHAPSRVRRLLIWFAEPRFLVSVIAVVRDEHNRVLLLKHRFRQGGGWGLPGGFVKIDEDPEDALRRELREETQLELRDVEIVFAQTIASRRHIEIFYRCFAHGEATPHSAEIERLAWFNLTDVPPSTSRKLRRIIHHILDA